MSTIGPLLTGLLPDHQVLEGFRAEEWAVADRVPEAVVFPETEEEVSAVLRLSEEHGWSCVAAGKGTWLQAGEPPAAVDVVMSLNRMDRVVEYEPGDLTVTVEAGIGLDLLARRTAERGQWLPLDPPGLARGTLGATIATASAGPLQAGFGTPRDHVLGATLVRADGTPLRLGSKVVKNVAGFDLLKLAIGSWGTIGVITSVTTRLHPLPEVDRAILFNEAGDAPLIDLAMDLMALRAPLSGLDLLVPGEAERAGPGASPLVVVRIADSLEVADEVQRLVLERAPVRPERVIQGPNTERLFQNVRAVEEGAELVLRLRSLPSRLPRLLELSESVRELVDPNRSFGMRRAAHVSSGVLRVIVSRLLRGDGWLDRVLPALGDLRAMVELEGGSLRVSQGPSELVGAFGSWGDIGGGAELVRGVKGVFDPEGRMSPGRLGTV